MPLSESVQLDSSFSSVEVRRLIHVDEKTPKMQQF